VGAKKWFCGGQAEGLTRGPRVVVLRERAGEEKKVRVNHGVGSVKLWGEKNVKKKGVSNN